MNTNTGAARERYVELLKATLSFTLWKEPPVPLGDACRFFPPALQRMLLFAGKLIQRIFRVSLGYARNDLTDTYRAEGRPYYSAYAETMIGLRRLDNIQYCVESVIREAVEGDLIETGVWRGGACIFMRGVLAAHGVADRRVFVADSFAGLPKPDLQKYPHDRGNYALHKNNLLKVTYEQVRNNFQRYGLLDDQVVFLVGWFEDTLPRSGIEKLGSV